MVKDNKENKARRSERVPKPKLKEKTTKTQNNTDIKAKNKMSVAISSAAEKSFSMEEKSVVMTSEGEIASRPIEPLRSSGNKVCKKQAKKSVRKLGLFCIDCGEIDGSHKINMDAFNFFLRQNIKVDGKKNDKRIQIERQNMHILISAEIFVEQKYIKFLIKKYLKKTKLHNWIKIENGKKMYKLKNFAM